MECSKYWEDLGRDLVFEARANYIVLTLVKSFPRTGAFNQTRDRLVRGERRRHRLTGESAIAFESRSTTQEDTMHLQDEGGDIGLPKKFPIALSSDRSDTS